MTSSDCGPVTCESESLSYADAHRAYIEGFLADGFKALAHLDKLDKHCLQTQDKIGLGCEACDENEQQEHQWSPSLGPEKAGKLFAACAAESSLLSAVYWTICARSLIGSGPIPNELRNSVIDLVLSCLCAETGGFSPHPAHPDHILATLSAVQICILLGLEDQMLQGWSSDIEIYIESLRLSDGSYRGRSAAASEGDSRFVYAAVCTLTLLKMFSSKAPVADLEITRMNETKSWLLRCQNMDGGFGSRPDGECESHAGHTFCCLAALSLIDRSLSCSPQTGAQDTSCSNVWFNSKTLGRLKRWFCERQCPQHGGLNGRIGKKPDSCYTWWTLASLDIFLENIGEGLSVTDFCLDSELRGFLAKCTRAEGGMSAHPGENPDPFHTFFGLAGLSLLEHGCFEFESSGRREPWLGKMNPSVALPVAICRTIS